MVTIRGLVALAVLLLPVAVSAQVVVPRDWKRIDGAVSPDSELASCASQGGGALFRVAFDGPRLNSTVMKQRDRTRDPAPYELDWAAALDQPPAPPGIRSDVTAWAATAARERATRVVVPVDDGYLIGFGHGEYGGSLWWYPREPGQGVKLTEEVVHGIVAAPERGTYIVISGLAHMGMNSGAALWVNRDEQGQWRIRARTPLDESPEIHAARSDGILLVNRATVDLLTWSGELRTIQRSRISTLAGSFAFGPTGEIAIGRSVVVSVLRPTGTGAYREELYVPRECQKFTYWRELVCMCAGAPLMR